MPSLSKHVVSQAEWLEADGLGGFASGTACGIRTRRYHALLLVARTPPADRVVLVNGFEAWVETDSGSYPITSQLYAPDVVHPPGRERITGFVHEPWPCWDFQLPDGTCIRQEIFALPGQPTVCLSWQRTKPISKAILRLRPLISGRDFHNLHHENPRFRFDAAIEEGRVSWQPYPDLPAIHAAHNGSYEHRPDWYRDFLYAMERQRGLDCEEDLASPGEFHWDLTKSAAVWMLSTDASVSAVNFPDFKRAEHDRRAQFESPLHRAAEQYLVRRGHGKTIIAGYPWFGDWGRDTFIAIRGLCIASGRLADARLILLAWADHISDGMLPNRFPDHPNDPPEYNSVDASLWYIIAVDDLRSACERVPGILSAEDRKKFAAAIQEILTGYAGGTRYGIHLDTDGLLMSGVAGTQLTWMDVKIGETVVTPRIGKPVEVQALWLNALWIAGRDDPKWQAIFLQGVESFRQKFWNEKFGYLNDVVDADRVAGRVDTRMRPNQILAIGGLHIILIPDQARQVVDAVERELVTPLGLRSLSPRDPAYRGSYSGGVRERDMAYHQGTVWPWLMGPFIESWVLVRNGTNNAREEARQKFLFPLIHRLEQFGLGHLPEIADGDKPYRPKGCPFQAWSLGELLRIGKWVLT